MNNFIRIYKITYKENRQFSMKVVLKDIYEKEIKDNENLNFNILEKYCITRTSLMRLFCDYSIVFEELNIPFDYSVSNKEKEYLKYLIDYYKILRRTPTFEEIHLNKNIPSPSTYRYHFGTLNNAYRLAKIPISRERFCKKSDKELLNDLVRLRQILKRIPLSRDIRNCNFTFTDGAYNNRFGNLFNVYKLLGWEKDYYIHCQLGNVILDDNNEPCRSNIELDISNWLISHNIKYSKEHPYNKVLKNDKSRRRFDWCIEHNGEKYFVEYFGLWGFDTFNYHHKAKRKIKDIYKSGLINKCIFIFPKDLKRKSFSEIFSFLFVA